MKIELCRECGGTGILCHSCNRNDSYSYIICSDCTRMTKKYKKSFKYASDNLAIIEWNGGAKK